jgi:hypothetical protein
VAELRLREANCGTGLAIVNRIDGELPPPGGGVRTVRLALPGAARSLEGTTAVKVPLPV